MPPEVKRVVNEIAGLTCESCIKSIPFPDSITTVICEGSDSKNWKSEMEPNDFCDCGVWLIELIEVYEDEDEIEDISSDIYSLNYVTAYSILFNKMLDSEE